MASRLFGIGSGSSFKNNSFAVVVAGVPPDHAALQALYVKKNVNIVVVGDGKYLMVLVFGVGV